MFEFLENLKNREIVSAVDFRKDLSKFLDAANRGIAVVVTSNTKQKAVLISPEQANTFFSQNEQVVSDETENAEELPDETVEEEVTAETPDVEASAPDKAYPVQDPSLPNCPACVPLSGGLVSRFHETLTAQHPGADDIPADAHEVDPTSNNVEQPHTATAPVMDQPVMVTDPSEAPVASVAENSDESSTTEASAPQANPLNDALGDTVAPLSVDAVQASAEVEETPENTVPREAEAPSEQPAEPGTILSDEEEEEAPVILCSASRAVPSLNCEREAVAYIHWRNTDMNICDFHRNQLLAQNQSFDEIGEPVSGS